MALENTDIQNKLTEIFGEDVSNFRMEHDLFTFDANAAVIKDVINFMYKNEEMRFNFLTDLCGIHYPANDKNAQFVVTYLLHNWVDNVRVRIKAYLDGDKPEIATITDIFNAANWMERETYDFFGINFIGHPNMKRILNVDSMTSHPMRKEYPMEDAGRSDKDDRFFGRTPHNAQN
jgi:NADH-quinone oxidoreductase subunit C